MPTRGPAIPPGRFLDRKGLLMFASITHHPNRGEWRSLFLTETEAHADADHFLSLFPAEPVTARVEPATLDDAAELVERADESYAECSAEAGSGAISLGYGVDGAYEAAAAVEPPSDPLYLAARAMVEATRPAAPVPAPIDPADIPF
jgi:hypothetical protein